MFKSILGFITGVILLYFSGDLINSSKETLNYLSVLQKALFFYCLALLAISIYRKSQLYNGSVLFCVPLLFGFSYAYDHAEVIVSSKPTSNLDRKIVQVRAFLCSLPKQNEYSYSASFCLLGLISKEGAPLPVEGMKAKLHWPLELDIAQGVSILDVKSKQARSTQNFIGHSYETTLFYERIVLAGSVESKVGLVDLQTLGFLNSLRYEYHQIRLKISAYVRVLLSEVPHKGVISALLLGDKSQLSAHEYKVLSNTGTQHLIAISGLHVGLVMLGIYYLLPRSFISVAIVSLVGFGYILLVGFGPSAQRAWVMCLCGLISLVGLIKKQYWRTYAVALFLVLVVDPLSTFTMGFWFSFICVAIILLMAQFMSLENDSWYGLLVLQVMLLFAMTPISSYLGMKHGAENIVANIFAVPWVSLVILPLTFLWFLVSTLHVGVSSFVLVFLDRCIEVLIAFLASLNVIGQPLSISGTQLGLGVFAVLFGLMIVFSKINLLRLCCFIGLTISVLFPSKLYSNNFEFTVFDVGQGLAIAIRSAGQIWLYDLGPKYEKSSATWQAVLPYLRQHQKSNLLTGVIIGHGDADHAGDLSALFSEFTPEINWSGQPERLSINNFNDCKYGDTWEGSGFKLEVIYPFDTLVSGQQSSNNHSCVVRLTNGDKVFLIMGDVDDTIELDLVSKYRHSLKADVLIASHHGAAKGTSYALMKHVQPDYIVFSAGYLNKFGHPSNHVMKRISNFTVQALNTAELGAIRFSIHPSSGEIVSSHARD